jgi:hypothetical protein
MSFATLKVNVSNLRASDPDLFNIEDYPNDASIQAVGYSNGYDRFKFDCINSFKITNESESTQNEILDTYVTRYESQLKRALLYVCLAEFYTSRSGGQLELNYERSLYYNKMYKNSLMDFVKFDNPNNKISKMGVYRIG